MFKIICLHICAKGLANNMFVRSSTPVLSPQERDHLWRICTWMVKYYGKGKVPRVNIMATKHLLSDHQ